MIDFNRSTVNRLYCLFGNVLMNKSDGMNNNRPTTDTKMGYMYLASYKP